MSRTRLDADKDSAKQTTVKKPKRGCRKRLAAVCACAAAVLAVVLGVASTASAVGQTDKGTHTLADLPASAERTWVVKTGENGVATTDKDGDGVDYTLPYGTYELAETSAPQGYLKTDEKITVTVHPEETGEKGDGYVFGSKVSWTADGGWNTHKNYSDVAKWSIDASKLDDEAGVWFGMNLNTSIMSSTAIVEGVSRCPNCQDSSA